MRRGIDGRSADELVTATVDAEGGLIGLALDPGLLHSATPAALSASTLEALASARAAAAGRRAEGAVAA